MRTKYLCMKGFCFFVVFLIFNQGLVKGEDTFSFTIKRRTVGVIVDKKLNKNIGSAFLVGSQKHIVTCAHVATKGDFSFKGISLATGINLKSAYYLPKYDLSVFILSTPIDCEPLKFGDIKKIRPGDTVVYIGWDKNISKMKANKAKVSSIGSALNSDVIIDFIEFQGEGLPGYSGAPVFDINGNVIAIMREGWKKQGVKGGQVVLMNRAFSIEILSILDSEVYFLNGTDKEASINDNSLKNLIDIKREK